MLVDSRTLPGTAGATTSLAVLCCLVTALNLTALNAQTPDQRRAIDAFRDSLQSVTDSLVLRAIEERALLAAKRARSDPMLHVRLGQLALRQGELGGAAHYDAAAAEFKWAAQLAPQWPYAWYGLGLAEYALGARVVAGRGSGAGSAWSRASAALARAGALEPGLAPRLEELVYQALREGRPEQAVVLREALRRAVGELNGPRGARLLLALGRVQRATGDTGAVASLEAYLATGEQRALALLELGRAQLLRGELRGMATYLGGATDEDPVAVAEYRADLLPLAQDAELMTFELSRGHARSELLRRFWTGRDRLELRQEGERLAEHLRRLLVARREFVVMAPDGTARLDDRGRIYVRHGEPDDRASFALAGVEPNESWRYRRGGADLVLHFVSRQGPGDFRLVESVLDVAGAGPLAAGTRTANDPGETGWVGGGAERLFRSRSALAPVYEQARPTRRDRFEDYLEEERALGRRGIQVGTSSDSYPLRFERALDAWGALLVAGGTAAQPAVQVVFAIPGYAIAPASGVAGVVYPVRVRFVALDPDGAVTAAVDTITPIGLSDPIPANRSLLGRIAVPVRPGRLVAHAAIQYGDQAGTAFEVDTVVVPAPGAGELALGDLLIGTPRGRLKLPLGDGQEIALSPGGLVRRSDGFEVGIEVFGLEPGARAELQVLLAPVDTGRADAEALPRWRSYPDRRAQALLLRQPGAGPIVSWHAALPLNKLKPGSWRLAVLVTDAAGRAARRESVLVVAVP